MKNIKVLFLFFALLMLISGSSYYLMKNSKIHNQKIETVSFGWQNIFR